MKEIFLALIQVINQNVLWILFALMYIISAKLKLDWVTSVRSVATVIITLVFAQLALGSKIDPKDVMLVTSLVFNFYFLVKQRQESQINNKGGIK